MRLLERLWVAFNRIFSSVICLKLILIYPSTVLSGTIVYEFVNLNDCMLILFNQCECKYSSMITRNIYILELPDVFFSLVSMDHLSDLPFSVKQENGQIVVSSALDYEKVCFKLKFLLEKFR